MLGNASIQNQKINTKLNKTKEQQGTAPNDNLTIVEGGRRDRNPLLTSFKRLALVIRQTQL